ncbi:MAG TPA: FAD-dependent oxidoreductase [Actinomycetota bacterium]
MDGRGAERFETVIIGGGQAGLATGYHLRKRERRVVILDAHDRIGDAWRTRWDSLRLFTPARYDGLPGWPFPASPWSFPTKDEMADYLEAYAERFDLPVRTGLPVDGLSRQADRYVVSAGHRRFEADNVVVASGAHHIPKVPAFAAELAPDIVQLHSKEYRGPSQLREGDVLLVGAGNSGAEIGIEVSRFHRTWLSGPDTGHIPVRHGSVAARFGFSVFRFFGHHVLTTRTPIGRKLRPKLITKGDPLIRVKPKDLAAAGVERVARVVGVRDGRPLLADDRVLDVANVVWCTGFRTDFGWIELPVFGDDGQPVHHRGVVGSEPGLYFVGLVFLYSLSSDVLPSRGRDAEYIAKRIASRARNGRPRADVLAGT